MRFLHTADWHLGRLFHGIHLTDDQAHLLDGVHTLVKDSKPDVVVIAGDIYDRSVPPPEAVKLFDEVLTRLALDIKVPVIVIAGNHDSPDRLGFGSKLLSEGRVHIFGPLVPNIGMVTLHDSDGPVRFCGLPYADPATARSCFADESVSSHETAMRCCLTRINDQGSDDRRVLIAHAFVVGGAECESERPLSVGGASTVPVETFDGFDYVALGHLHRPQSLSGGKVCYSGSLMKYSFSEADHIKTVSIIEMDGSGVCKAEHIPLTPRRDVRVLKGLLADVLKGPSDGKSKDDYIHVNLEDAGALLDPMSRIREVYPNALSISREVLAMQPCDEGKRVDHTRLNDLDLFNSFFGQVTGESMTAGQSAQFVAVVEDLRKQEREVIA
jgi:exonuclease SbcD